MNPSCRPSQWHLSCSSDCIPDFDSVVFPNYIPKLENHAVLFLYTHIQYQAAKKLTTCSNISIPLLFIYIKLLDEDNKLISNHVSQGPRTPADEHAMCDGWQIQLAVISRRNDNDDLGDSQVTRKQRTKIVRHVLHPRTPTTSSEAS